jgi:hypothetical protein
MNLRALASSLSLLVVICSLCACSDDTNGTSKDAGSDGGHAGTGGNHMAHDAGEAADSGAPGKDSGAPSAEGAVCAATSDCDKGLRCIQASNDSVSIGICARPCASREQCEAGEICYAYTTDPADAHCVNLVKETYAFCGVGETSRCDHHTCLYFPSSTVGLCVDLCSLSGDADAGTDDSGVALATCSGSETCIDGVVDSPTQGLCGTSVAPGAKCGVQSGRFCTSGYGCTLDDPKVATGQRHCREDCSDDGKCKTGSCKGVVGQTAFCY